MPTFFCLLPRHRSPHTLTPCLPSPPQTAATSSSAGAWRTTNPALSEPERARLVQELMDARRAIKAAKANGDGEALVAARRAVDSAKRGLGERGPVWWTDGDRDWNRHLVKNSPYAGWFNQQANGEAEACEL